MTIAEGSAMFTIVFMSAGVLLTPIIFVAAALVVVGHFKPSRKMQRAGYMIAAIWLLPAACWTYYLQIFTEQDRDRVLSKPEVVYGISLPAGAQVSYRRWARRLQWVNLPNPQTIQGVEYVNQVTFCNQHVCSGTLARDQEIEGVPCSAQTPVQFSPTTTHLTECTLSRSLVREGVTIPPGTAVQIGTNGKPSTRNEKRGTRNDEGGTTN
jgi:hypothetical protein